MPGPGQPAPARARWHSRAFGHIVDRCGGRHDVDPDSAYRRRFLVGTSLVAVGVAVPSSVISAVTGQSLTTLAIGGFCAGVVMLGALLRRSRAVDRIVWAYVALLAVFMFVTSIMTDPLVPQQLGWLVLFPILATFLPSSREEPRRIHFTPIVAFVIAAALGAAIILAHRTGLTFHQPVLGSQSDLDNYIEYAVLLSAVSALLAMLDRLLRNVRAENRSLLSLLPVCAWCRKIREPDSTWQSLETHLRRAGTQVTHSICPTCAEGHFPDQTTPPRE